MVLAKEQYNIRERDVHALGAEFVTFTAQTRMSGVNLDGHQIRKGAADSIEAYVQGLGGIIVPFIGIKIIDVALTAFGLT